MERLEENEIDLKNNIDIVLDALRKIKSVCNYASCSKCVCFDSDGCIFHNKPFDWNIGYLDK